MNSTRHIQHRRCIVPTYFKLIPYERYNVKLKFTDILDDLYKIKEKYVNTIDCAIDKTK